MARGCSFKELGSIARWSRAKGWAIVNQDDVDADIGCGEYARSEHEHTGMERAKGAAMMQAVQSAIAAGTQGYSGRNGLYDL
jgi:hypothetical protein